MQQLSGQHFPKNIEMVSKKSVVLKKGRPDRTKYVFLLSVTWIPKLLKSTNTQCKKPVMNVPCAVLLGAASCFSLYHQCKDYENKYKEIKPKEGNTD